MASYSRSSSNTSLKKPTVNSSRGATITLPFDPDLPSASRRKQQPHPPTDAPSSSVEAAASHRSTMPVGGGTTKFTSDLDSSLSSLPLYDGGLYERFGHDVYVRAEKSGGEAPSYYMPPPYYWQNHARAIRRIVLTDDLVRRLWTTRDGDDTEYAKILELFVQGEHKHNGTPSSLLWGGRSFLPSNCADTRVCNTHPVLGTFYRVVSFCHLQTTSLGSQDHRLCSVP